MKAVLVVIDMQRDFVDGVLGTKEAREITKNVADRIRGFDGDVIVTQDTHDEAYLNTQEGKLLPVEHCLKDSDGWKLHPVVEAAVSERSGGVMRICKPTFASHELAGLLKAYDKAYLCGVCTDICVVSNALLIKSFYPEMPITVDASCCAGTSPEMHGKALDVMKSCQIMIV